ncbi:ribosome recycling factor domain-containing protein [Phlyctochytrium arcticum]|nr:ribosome recycling factor domain-containing protein [Phlyctochytrium arcticum]
MIYKPPSTLLNAIARQVWPVNIRTLPCKLRSIQAQAFFSSWTERTPWTSTLSNTVSSCQLEQRRFYAKKKGPAKSGKDTKRSSDDSSEDDVEFSFDTSKYGTKMERSVDRLKTDLAALRVGRATPALLEKVMVAHNNARLPLSQVAQINIKDAQTLMVILNEEEFMGPVDKAIRGADLGLNPQKQDQSVLKVAIPKATKEFVASIMKQATQLTDKARSNVRAIRADARTDLKKATKRSVSADLIRNKEAEIQTITDKHIKELDGLLTKKQKEVEKS